MSKKRTPQINFSKIQWLEDFDMTKFTKIFDEQISPILKTQTPKNQEYMDNYLIIRIVAIIESTLRGLSQQLIDKHNVDIKKLFTNNELTISIDDIERIKADMTKGKIISTNFNFQNKKDINFVFSHLFKINFLETFKIILEKDVGDFFKGVEDLPKEFSVDWDKFFNIFDVRNEIAHSVNITKKLTHKEIVNVRTNSFAFLAITIILSIDIMHLKQSGSLENKELEKILMKQFKDWEKQH